MSGSSYYISVAIDPSSLAKARSQILSLARDVQAATTISLGGGTGQNSATSAAQAVLDLYRQQASAQARATTGAQTSAKAEAAAVEGGEKRKQAAIQQTARVKKAAEVEPKKASTGTVANRTMTADEYRQQDSDRRRKKFEESTAARDLDPRKGVERSAQKRREFERKQIEQDKQVQRAIKAESNQRIREEMDARNKQWIAARTDQAKIEKAYSDGIKQEASLANKRRSTRADAAQKEVAQLRSDREKIAKALRDRDADVDKRVEQSRQRQTPSPYPGRNVRDETRSLERIGSNGGERDRAVERQAKARAARAAEDAKKYAQAEAQLIKETGQKKVEAQKLVDKIYDRQRKDAERENVNRDKASAQAVANAKKQSAQAISDDQKKYNQILDRQYREAHQENARRDKASAQGEVQRAQEIQKLRADAQRRLEQRGGRNRNDRPSVTPLAAAPANARENKGLQQLIEYQRSGLASSNVLARGLAGLSTELNHVGGTATGASHAIARGAGSMRLMAAATAETAARMSLYGAGAAVIFGVVNVLGKVKDAALDADEAMINLSRVVDSNTFNRGTGSQEMIRLMREMALGANDVGTAFFEMGKLVDSQKDAISGAETVLLATKIAELDVTSASQQLIKVQKAFGLGAEDLESVLDRLNDQQNRLGVDIGKSLMGISRAAGVTKTVGGELDNLVARITVLQRLSGFAPETVSRVNQRLAIQLATLKGQTRIAQSLQGTGVSLISKEGTTKTIDELLSDIGAKYSTFSKEQQANISLALTGGVAGGLSSLTTTLLQNYGEVERQVINVRNSQGSARQELEKTMKSARNQIALLGTELQAIGVNLADSGLLTVFGVLIGMLKETLELTNDLLGVFNQMPDALKTSLVGIGALAATVKTIRAVSNRAGGAAVAGGAAAGGAGNAVAMQRRYELAVQRSVKAVGLLAAGHERLATIQANAVAVTDRQAVANQSAAAGFARLAIAEQRAVISAERLALATNLQATANTRAGLSSAIGSKLKGGGGIFGAGLLASILGGMAEDLGKERNNSRLEQAGSVAQGAGTGALIGSLVPIPGAGVAGAAIGGVISLYKSQAEKQREAGKSLDSLTASAHRLRVAQENNAKQIIDAEPQKAVTTSDAKADALVDLLKKGTPQADVAIQSAKDRTDLIKKLENQLSARPNGVAPATGESREAMQRFLDALKSGEEGTLTFGDSVAAFGNKIKFEGKDNVLAAAGFSDKRIKGAGGIRSAFGITSEANVISALEEAGYSAQEIESGLREANDIIIREALRTTVGAAITASGKSAAGRILDINQLRTDLLGGRGLEEQSNALGQIDKVLSDYYDSIGVINDPNADQQSVSAAKKKAASAIKELEAQDDVFAELFGQNRATFIASLNAGLNDGQNKIVVRLLGRVRSLGDEVKGKLRDDRSASILGADEEALDAAAATSLSEFKGYVEEIEALGDSVSAGRTNAKAALDQALTNAVLVNRASKQAPGNDVLAGQVGDVEGAMLALAQEQVDAIKGQVEAGIVKPGKGASDILVLQSAIEAQRGRISPKARATNLANMSSTINDLVETQTEQRIKEAKDAVSGAAPGSEDKRHKQRALRNLQAAKGVLDAAIDSGTKTLTPAMRKAFRAIGVNSEAIGAIELAYAGAQRTAQRQAQVKQRNQVLTQVKAANILQRILANGNAFMKSLLKLIPKTTGQEKQLAELNKLIADGDKEANANGALTKALNGGGTTDEPALSGVGADTSAKDAADAANEARDKAMDLISARFEYLKALAGDDPVRVAKLELQEQQELAKFAKSRADRLRAKAAIINAKRAVREAILESAGGLSTFGIPNDIKLPNAFEVKAAAAGAMRGAAGQGVGEGVGPIKRSDVNVSTTNRNSIVIQVANAKDVDKVTEAMSVATGADVKAMRSAGFSGGGLL